MADLDQYLPLIVAGDADAFGRWVAGAEVRLRLSLRRYAADVDVEAVLQEALLRIWQVAPRFVADGAPNGLLRLGIRIARNLAVSEIRRDRLRSLPEEDLEAVLQRFAEPFVPTGADPRLREAIASCRERLPRKPAMVLGKRLEPRQPVADHVHAEALGMRLNTFLQNLSRARKLMAECLRKLGIDLRAELR